MTEDDIIATFRATENPCLVTLGGEPVAYERARARATIRCRPLRRHCHSLHHPGGGIVQGGFITGWLDAAMAHACIAKSEFTVAVPSLEIKVSFLLPAHPDQTYLAHGWVVRMGKRICFMEGELVAENGDVIARASSTAALAVAHDAGRRGPEGVRKPG
jgi:acyl-CoA thioesterase